MAGDNGAGKVKAGPVQAARLFKPGAYGALAPVPGTLGGGGDGRHHHQLLQGIALIAAMAYAIALLPQAAEARSFIVYNISDASKTYFIVNGTSGNVGIGTASPKSPLHIVGYTNAYPPQNNTLFIDPLGSFSNGGLVIGSQLVSGSYYPIVQSFNNVNLIINPNGGNVGIGTTSPGSLLNIYGAGQTQFRLDGNTGAGSSGPEIRLINNVADTVSRRTEIGFYSGATRNWAILADDGANAGQTFSILDSRSAQRRLLIDSTGNVGIGTTSPQAKLDVAGATSTNTLKILSPTTTVANSVTQVSVNSPGGWTYNTSAWSYTGIDLTAGTWIVQYTAYLQWVYPMPYMVGYLNFGLGTLNYQSGVIPYTVATCANPGDQTISGLFIANLTSTQNLNVTLTIYGGDQNCPYYCSISCTTQLNLVKKGVGNDNSKASIMINAIKLG